ncbi:MAG: hypothetical protein WC473_01285 [Patescibacteria group bacterium]
MAERKASAAALLAALNGLSDEEMLALADNSGKLKKFCGALVAEEIANTFCVPLSDNELQKQFPQFADRLAPWRKLAAEMNYSGPVSWLVKQGFTLKKHASIVGPCNNNLNYLQGWNFNDAPTDDVIIFWVPRLAPKSTGKDIKTMEAHRAELKKRYELPGDHATYFGSIQILFAIILAHFKRSGERVPLDLLYAASGTLFVGGRLVAGVFSSTGGVGCDCWREDGNGCVGFFLLGVEKVSQDSVLQQTQQTGDENA